MTDQFCRKKWSTFICYVHFLNFVVSFEYIEGCIKKLEFPLETDRE